MTADQAGEPAAGTLPAAVLWDLDGTLVDTEPYWVESEFELVRAYGGRWSTADAHAMIGMHLPDAGRYLREHSGIPLTPQEIVTALVDAVVARVRAHVPWRPGARELLAGLHAAAVPCALVTMSYRVLVEPVLACLPAGSFGAVVCGDEVTHGKPHPEPYLRGAQLLGVPPQGCVAIEDSPTGVASAQAAGVPVLAVQHLVPLATGPGRRVVHTLDGVRPADLVTVGHESSAADLAGRDGHRSLPNRDAGNSAAALPAVPGRA